MRGRLKPAMALALLVLGGCEPAPGYFDGLGPVEGASSPFTETTELFWLAAIPAALLWSWLTRRRLARRRPAEGGGEPDAASPEPPAAVADAMTPLRCPACGAKAPYADAATTSCAHCRAEVEVPETYRALGPARRRARQLGDARARAFRVHNLLTNGFALPLGLAAYAVLMVGSVTVGDACDYAPYHGYYVLLGLTLLAGTSGFLISMTASAVAIRRIDPTPLILPPAPWAGFGSCRHCDATIAIPAPAHVVAICDYCGTEHLVAGRAVRARAVAEGQSVRHAQSIAAAGEAIDLRLRKLERGAWRLLTWFLVCALLWVLPTL